MTHKKTAAAGLVLAGCAALLCGGAALAADALELKCGENGAAKLEFSTDSDWEMYDGSGSWSPARVETNASGTWLKPDPTTGTAGSGTYQFRRAITVDDKVKLNTIEITEGQYAADGQDTKWGISQENPQGLYQTALSTFTGAGTTGAVNLSPSDRAVWGNNSDQLSSWQWSKGATNYLIIEIESGNSNGVGLLLENVTIEAVCSEEYKTPEPQPPSNPVKLVCEKEDTGKANVEKTLPFATDENWSVKGVGSESYGSGQWIKPHEHAQDEYYRGWSTGTFTSTGGWAEVDGAKWISPGSAYYDPPISTKDAYIFARAVRIGKLVENTKVQVSGQFGADNRTQKIWVTAAGENADVDTSLYSFNETSPYYDSTETTYVTVSTLPPRRRVKVAPAPNPLPINDYDNTNLYPDWVWWDDNGASATPPREPSKSLFSRSDFTTDNLGTFASLDNLDRTLPNGRNRNAPADQQGPEDWTWEIWEKGKNEKDNWLIFQVKNTEDTHEAGKTVVNKRLGSSMPASAPEGAAAPVTLYRNADWPTGLAAKVTLKANLDCTCPDGKEQDGNGNCVCPADKPVEVDGVCMPVCTEGQAVSSPCACQAPMANEGGICVTPTPPVCTDGQAIASPCTCVAPMVDDGNGVCVAQSSSSICPPSGGCSSAPVAGWPALLGLGAVLPLLARRRRRK